jgi:hypothetical protein
MGKESSMSKPTYNAGAGESMRNTVAYQMFWCGVNGAIALCNVAPVRLPEWMVWLAAFGCVLAAANAYRISRAA